MLANKCRPEFLFEIIFVRLVKDVCDFVDDV